MTLAILDPPRLRLRPPPLDDAESLTAVRRRPRNQPLCQREGRLARWAV